jgi:hypothetical protein
MANNPPPPGSVGGIAALPGIRTIALLLLALLLPWGGAAHAYSLLTHEHLIDLTWKDSIVPLLLSRYPTLTPAELERARAYAYGGCVIQDIGYYPFGDKAYSNLTHYVRSGDFVVNLFRDATNADELAFAVGARGGGEPGGSGRVSQAGSQVWARGDLRAGRAPACANRVCVRHQ